MNLNTLNLSQLTTLRRLWTNIKTKDFTRQGKAIDTINAVIAQRESAPPIRCALPKKQQRKLGLLPPVQ